MGDWWNPFPTVGSTVAGAVRTYVHRSATLAADVQAGRTAALSGVAMWTASNWRGWIASGAALCADLTGGLEQGADGTLAARIGAGDGWRADAAALFGRTVEIIAGETVEADDVVPEDPETSGGEVGVWPVAVVAIVVIGAVAAVGWCGYQAAQVIDRLLARDAAARELIRTDEIAQRMVDAHLERERAAGKSLPLDAATAEALETLRQRQLLAAPHAPPLAVPGAELGGGWFGGFSAGGLVAAAVVLAFIFAPHLMRD
jgi:hypothetical protein